MIIIITGDIGHSDYRGTMSKIKKSQNPISNRIVTKSRSNYSIVKISDMHCTLIGTLPESAAMATTGVARLVAADAGKFFLGGFGGVAMPFLLNVGPCSKNQHQYLSFTVAPLGTWKSVTVNNKLLTVVSL